MAGIISVCGAGCYFHNMEFHDRIILHPTDFSENAAAALKAALDLLAIPKSRLFVVHILDIPHSREPLSADDLGRQFAEKTKDAGQQMDQYLEKCFSGVEVNPLPVRIIEQSEIGYKGILDVIHRIEPYMIVVGRTGNSKIKNLSIGSTAQHLIEKSHRPVVVVPPTV